MLERLLTHPFIHCRERQFSGVLSFCPPLLMHGLGRYSNIIREHLPTAPTPSLIFISAIHNLKHCIYYPSTWKGG